MQIPVKVFVIELSSIEPYIRLESGKVKVFSRKSYSCPCRRLNEGLPMATPATDNYSKKPGVNSGFACNRKMVWNTQLLSCVRSIPHRIHVSNDSDCVRLCVTN